MERRLTRRTLLGIDDWKEKPWKPIAMAAIGITAAGVGSTVFLHEYTAPEEMSDEVFNARSEEIVKIARAQNPEQFASRLLPETEAYYYEQPLKNGIVVSAFVASRTQAVGLGEHLKKGASYIQNPQATSFVFRMKQNGLLASEEVVTHTKNGAPFMYQEKSNSFEVMPPTQRRRFMTNIQFTQYFAVSERKNPTNPNP